MNMKRNKVAAMFMALGMTLALCLGGCGSASTKPALKSAITYEKVDKDKDTDKEKNTDKDNEADEGTAKDTNKDKEDATTETTTKDTNKKTTDSKSTKATTDTKSSSSKSGGSSSKNSGNSSKSNSGNSSKPSSGNSSKPSSGGTSQSKPSQPAHTHSYSSSVTTQPTCGKAGVRTYTCSCGNSYTESIPATGNHKWEKQYKTETVPAKTHQENVWKEICYGCGAQFDDPEDALRHVMAVFGDACSSYYSDIVDTITVIDEPETTKDVYIGSKCSVCGAWQ